MDEILKKRFPPQQVALAMYAEIIAADPDGGLLVRHSARWKKNMPIA